MNTLRHVLLLSMLILFLGSIAPSCVQQDYNALSNDAIGEWKCIGEVVDGRLQIDSSRYTNRWSALHLTEYQTFEWYLGRPQKNVDRGDRYGTSMYYEGMVTWADDTLHLYSYQRKMFEAFIVSMRSSDTMILASPGSNVAMMFVSVAWSTETHMKFDAVAVVTSPCYGSCPIQSILVWDDSSYEYTGSENTRLKGTYAGRLPAREWDRIEGCIRAARPDTLATEYAEDATDLPWVKLILYYNGSIVKEIIDRGAAAPERFHWAVSRICRVPSLIDTNLTTKKDSGLTVDLLDWTNASP